MKPSKEGYEAAKELNKLSLDKLTCQKHCYRCIYWGNNFCELNMLKSIIEKSNKYLENHKD